MKRFVSAASLGPIALGLIACGSYEKNEAAYNQANATYSEQGGNYSGTATATTSWPTGSRIIVEKGVTYRVEPGGTRIELGPNDSRIVLENGVRYRVDPSGTRVRIDPSGAEIIVNPPGTAVNVTTNM